VRTAIVSDLHLGASSREDVLGDAAIRRLLFEEIAAADRLVLLGDVVELRDRPLGAALESSRPFFEELGAALGADAEVTLVPGNHDHRLAEPLLDRISLDGGDGLGLEQTAEPSPGPTALIEEWLAPARLRIAYPGLWLREDVYVTHGHYMDTHLTLPRAECIAAALVMRFAGRPPDPATPTDYERVLRPLYGFSYGVAQARRSHRSRRRDAPSEAAWELLSGGGKHASRRRRLAGRAARTAFPAGIRVLNRLLRADFTPDISTAAIFSSGLEAAAEMARRLGLDGVQVITGHTHRGGPLEGEPEWPLPGGGRLHNSGSWVFASAFHHPGTPPSPYWPGTVTWIEENGPPRRARLLHSYSHREMLDLIERTV
jgi:UDP-2,3-diacylglucosamine pyrophosphatase LpxH